MPHERALRIALLTHSTNPRGGVVHTLELGAALHRLGHAVTVIAPAQPGQRFFRAVPHAVELVPVGPAPAKLADLVSNRIEAITAHLERQMPPVDVWHAHDGIGGNALAHLVEAGAIEGFVRTVHHLDPFDDARLAGWQERAVRSARRVFCVSRTWCDILARDHAIDAALVDNGVDLARFRPRGADLDVADAAWQRRLGLRPGAPLVLAVGGIEARKNTLRLLDAFVELRRTHAHAQLVIAGGASLLDHGAYEAGFAARLRETGLDVGRDVCITGPLDDAAMPALFRAADVLAMPSLREGFGLVVLEALASGTPVVVSEIEPFTGYLGDTVAAGQAFYADPLDPRSIAAALARAVATPRWVSAPPVCVRHDWLASAQRHVELYRHTLAATAPATFAA